MWDLSWMARREGRLKVLSQPGKVQRRFFDFEGVPGVGEEAIW